ncbi:aldehyde dehydrogenase family 3 member B1-like protein [Thamnocephalis sphaerospora]|uniref:Aldehyde dehydrogenase n=1 Tax=Thamnocephalis sphaerospora TaxID=78915 RepID=A0A4V1IVP4_9FUNG|nr:aldehyde dehydrogenase family 3 member B1-like protein [Thamnocephalis sphaerospora]|eukprot:RKP04769.1 aldehyde dehydrogenase family 3 member B1-like protein [Thamnocephalis sphaerospora]
MTQSTLAFSTHEEIDQCTADLAATFRSGLTRPLAFRKQQLRQLLRMLDENEDALTEALRLDLNKHYVEAMTTEITLVRDETARAIDKLSSWAASDYPSTRFTFMLSRPHVRKEPQGMVLVMGAWNYPITLLLSPVVAAIAAGNTVPSEVSSHTAQAITKLLPVYMDQRAYRVVNGAADECTYMLNKRFDHIFYTGNGVVGRIIMQAAAKHLTPVTLELGGKSPVIIHRSCNLKVAAQRIFYGKFLNCGQTCIAPDYVLCPSDLLPGLVDALRGCYQHAYDGDGVSSTSYGRIINHRHFDRLHGLLKESKAKGEQVLMGGNADRDTKYIEPTVVACTVDSPLMRDEIFGPLLPIIAMDTVDEAVDFVNSRDQPLALYLFATDKKVIKHILDSTRSGGACVNDTVLQFAIGQIPFGGTGHSGIGRYHGKYGFDTFSHMRATLHSGYADEPLRKSFIYPPYNIKKMPVLAFALSKYTLAGRRANSKPSGTN